MAGALCLLSGGLDSTTLLYQTLEEYEKVRAVSFDYGQRHRRELGAARDIAYEFGIPHDVIDLWTLGRLLRGSALSDPSVEVPHGHYAKDTMAITIVPNRNAIMLNCAVGIAIGVGLDAVRAAMHAGDHAVYPDCRPQFITAMNILVKVATETDVAIEAPFIHKSKAEIVKLGAQLGVPWEMTWSCYEGGSAHCGRCGTCVERQEAFAEAGVFDPTRYVDAEFWKQEVRSR